MSKIKKLGYGIVAFEGTEMLKNVIYEIRDLCDFVVVCLQQKSYHGDPIKDADVKRVENLKALGYVDEIIWFEAVNDHADDVNGNGPRMIETDKRNFIIDYLEQNGCSHVIIVDSDEYYDHTDFANAKRIFDESEDMHVSYCEYVNYYRDFMHVMVWPFRCYVPFITEVSYKFDYYNGSFNRPSDPTRRYVLGDNKAFTIFSWKTIKMHHLSWIRLHIEEKINAWSAKTKFDNLDEICKASLDRYYNYVDGLNAIIMFNTPNYQVVVNKLPKEYIHPMFPIDAEPKERYNRE